MDSRYCLAQLTLSTCYQVNSSTRRHHVILMLVGCLLLHLCLLGSAQQVAVCSPRNATPPLTCTSDQWVSVMGEFYVPQVAGSGSGTSTNCQPNMTSPCNVALFSAGLKTNCNGPVGAEPCREEVDVKSAREQTPCLRNESEVAAIVQYSCVKGSDVLDLCDTQVRLSSDFSTSFQMVHLASPAFPASPSSGNLCTCRLQGSLLRVRSVQVSVTSHLPWRNDVNDGSDYEAVLAIRSNGNTLFKTNECADCTSVTSLNTILVSTGISPVSDESELTITYSDFGLEDQNVWLEITELGPDLNISCSSAPLPTDRLLTTTTTTTTTTATTPTTTAAPTLGPVVTSFTRTAATTRRSTTTDRGSRGGAGNKSKMDDSGGSGDSTTVVVLVVLLILLIAAGGILGFILYRRRGKCGADGKKGLKPMLQAWYRDMECCWCLNRRLRSPGDGQDAAHDGSQSGEFDAAAVAGGGGGGDHDHNGRQRQPPGVINRGFNGRPSIVKGDQKNHGKNVEIVDTEDGEMTIIHNEVYQAHRELVEGEMARMKQHKKEQRARGLNGTLGDSGTHQDSLPELRLAPSHLARNGDRAVTQDDDTARRLENNARAPTSANRQDVSRDASLDHEYETLKDYEHALSKQEQSQHRESRGNDLAQDHLYEDINTHEAASSHKRGRNLRKDTDISDESGPCDLEYSLTSRPKHRSRHTPGSAHFGSEQSLGSDTTPGAAPSSLPPGKVNPSSTQELLSPEEKDMFAALGLAGDTDPRVKSSEHPETHIRVDTNLKSELAVADRSRASGKDSDSSQNQENVHKRVKTKNAPKQEMVSDILELSLRDIKEKRREKDCDKGSGEDESALRGDDPVNRGSQDLGSQEGQVQMSEC